MFPQIVLNLCRGQTPLNNRPKVCAKSHALTCVIHRFPYFRRTKHILVKHLIEIYSTIKN